MGYRNIAECVADLRKNGQLKIIDQPVDPYLEMGLIQRRAFRKQSPALLFTRPVGCRFPMLANLFGTKQRLEFIFRDSLDALVNLLKIRANPALLGRKPWLGCKLLPQLPHAIPSRQNTSHNKTAPVLEQTCHLSDLPHLQSWPKDGGPFITLPLVHSQHPDSPKNANLGMYRIQLSGNEYAEDEVGLHYQLKRGIGIHHAAALARNMPLPVHIYVGGPPALTVAAIMPLPEGMSEIMFAGLLGGQRMRLATDKDFDLPVLGECDFFIQGHIMPELRPEGPFGDHLGYYSLRHPFPALKVKKVFHRHDAIWPFTTVGRPPQEDTILGDFIHELTGPMVGQVFAGVEEIRAVDAAGVHPLLLAIGHERYTPYDEHREPREIITQGLHLLGSTQTSLAKYLLITAREDSPGLNVNDVRAFIAHLLERTDFAKDLHFLTNVTCDTLDYSGSGLNRGSKVIWAAAGPKRRQLGNKAPAMPSLPEGFGQPRMVSAGILAIKGPKHDLPRSESDARMTGLGSCLRQWPHAEQFPLMVICDDPDFCASSFENFMWVAFTRSDPANDIYGSGMELKNKHWLCQAPLIIDARLKTFHAPPLEDDPRVIEKIEKMAVQGGPLHGII